MSLGVSKSTVAGYQPPTDLNIIFDWHQTFETIFFQD